VSLGAQTGKAYGIKRWTDCLAKISGPGQTAFSVTLSEGNFSGIQLFGILNFFLVPDHVFPVIFLGEDFEAKPLPERFSIIGSYESYHRVFR
jgi:hypothetical protein